MSTVIPPTPPLCPNCHRLACTCDSGAPLGIVGLAIAALCVLVLAATILLAWITP